MSSARAAAEQFVAISLVQPILANLRETNRTAAPFAPGTGERQFGAMMDAEVSLRIARASRFPLVDRLASDLLRRSRSTADAGPPAARPVGGIEIDLFTGPGGISQ
ncbi:MAG: hypothetical protein JNM07_00830 [Phycisphaerae bacterium]|nr:hypothetical protein [Phycisphaerae bacterium]